MSNVQTITDAILTTADAAWQEGPVVWPGEVFNPDAPAGRFATFSPGCDFADNMISVLIVISLKYFKMWNKRPGLLI